MKTYKVYIFYRDPDTGKRELLDEVAVTARREEWALVKAIVESSEVPLDEDLDNYDSVTKPINGSEHLFKEAP